MQQDIERSGMVQGHTSASQSSYRRDEAGEGNVISLRSVQVCHDSSDVKLGMKIYVGFLSEKAVKSSDRTHGEMEGEGGLPHSHAIAMCVSGSPHSSPSLSGQVDDSFR